MLSPWPLVTVRLLTKSKVLICFSTQSSIQNASSSTSAEESEFVLLDLENKLDGSATNLEILVLAFFISGTCVLIESLVTLNLRYSQLP